MLIGGSNANKKFFVVQGIPFLSDIMELAENTAIHKKYKSKPTKTAIHYNNKSVGYSSLSKIKLSYWNIAQTM